MQGDLERRKLELEITRLQNDRGEMRLWLAGAVGILTGVVGAAAPFVIARRTRMGALDQAVHEKRLACYPELVKATAPLALYFPDGEPAVSVSSEICARMGRSISGWYFDGGGLLMSESARDAYFKLARALTRASLAGRLAVPVRPRDAGDLSLESSKEYRRQLEQAGLNLNDVEAWTFGAAAAEQELSKQPAHLRFKDYLFLQRLSSELRSCLAGDLRSRERPS